MGRRPCSSSSDDHAGLKKGPWTKEEDETLVSYIRDNGHGSWRALPDHAGLNRCGKSCRLRWNNYLRPDIKRGKFSDDEETQIISLHSVLGNKWSAIAAELSGRTDNEIKNYWNTHIRKKLLRMGIDPVTHQQRPDLSFIANLPNLLAATQSMAPPAMDCGALQLQLSDSAQLATSHLVQILVQFLAGGSCSTTPISSFDMGPGLGFLHNNPHGVYGDHHLQPPPPPNLNYIPQPPYQGGVGLVPFVSNVVDGSLPNVFIKDHDHHHHHESPVPSPAMDNSSTTASLASSGSPWNIDVVVDQFQNTNNYSVCDGLDDLSGESFWKEILNQVSTSPQDHLNDGRQESRHKKKK